MLPSQETQLTRLTACRADLLDNGIDLARADSRALSRLVGRHLDYLQLMLGWDAGVREITRLVANSNAAAGAGFRHASTSLGESQPQRSS